MIPKVGGRYHYRQNKSFSLLIEITGIDSIDKVMVSVLAKLPDNRVNVSLGPMAYSWTVGFGEWEYLEGQDRP